MAAGSSPVIHPTLSTGAGAGARTDVLEREETDLSSQLASPWITIVWNDPVNLMTYVARVFRTYFGMPDEEAERCMMLVHTEGRAVVATGPREEMERHVEAMHGYGLWATLAQADS